MSSQLRRNKLQPRRQRRVKIGSEAKRLVVTTRICRRTHGNTECKVTSSSVYVMNTVKPMYEWKDIPWQKVERNVYKLQKRIYKASRRGDVKIVHKLQKLLIKSWYGRCLAVRRVSQDNQGKKKQQVWMVLRH